MQFRTGHENTPRAKIYNSSKQFIPLPNDKFSNWSKLKAFADYELKVVKMNKFVPDRVEKCWFPAFSPFPTMFSKGSLNRVIKSRGCVVKS